MFNDVSEKNPFFVRYYDAIRTQNGFYLILEHFSGQSLDIFLQQFEILSKTQVFEIVKQIIKGIQCMHSLGVIHLDIKPSNILIPLQCPAYPIRIIDPGICYILKSEQKEILKKQWNKESLEYSSQPNSLWFPCSPYGSQYFIAPEIYKAHLTIDGKADMYSLGVTLLYIFYGDKFKDILTQHKGRSSNNESTQFKFSKQFQECQISKFWKQIIIQLLYFNPEQRINIKQLKTIFKRKEELIILKYSMLLQFEQSALNCFQNFIWVMHYKTLIKWEVEHFKSTVDKNQKQKLMISSKRKSVDILKQEFQQFVQEYRAKYSKEKLVIWQFLDFAENTETIVNFLAFLMFKLKEFNYKDYYEDHNYQLLEIEIEGFVLALIQYILYNIQQTVAYIGKNSNFNGNIMLKHKYYDEFIKKDTHLLVFLQNLERLYDFWVVKKIKQVEIVTKLLLKYSKDKSIKKGLKNCLQYLVENQFLAFIKFKYIYKALNTEIIQKLIQIYSQQRSKDIRLQKLLVQMLIANSIYELLLLHINENNGDLFSYFMSRLEDFFKNDKILENKYFLGKNNLQNIIERYQKNYFNTFENKLYNPSTIEDCVTEFAFDNYNELITASINSSDQTFHLYYDWSLEQQTDFKQQLYEKDKTDKDPVLRAQEKNNIYTDHKKDEMAFRHFLDFDQ